VNSDLENLFVILWGALLIAEAVLCLWIAIIVFRKRTIATWITLVAATLVPLFAVAGYLWNLGFGTLTSNMDLHGEVSVAFTFGYAVAHLTFLIGVLLHLQRRKLESDRIADLEAILHDLQQRPKDAPTQPPR
jgi:hypothetical protein